MYFLELFLQNILTAPILFFALGMSAGFIKSDLNVPESISRYLSLYLMMSIGFKGGAALASSGSYDQAIWMTATAGIAFGFLQPVLGFFLLRHTTQIDRATAAAVSAHYGSVSMVTFVTAVSFLNINEIIFAGYIVAVLALMEAPAIVSGLLMAKGAAARCSGTERHRLIADVLTNGAIVLLIGSFLIGWVTGENGLKSVDAFLISPFQGVLCLFLLDMGLLAARSLHLAKGFSLSLAAFAFYMPVISACLGIIISYWIGLDRGTGFLFTTLCASASYIAVPAAMRLALPEAQPSIYIPMSLALTFPFNITLGIPLYYKVAEITLS
ncbi:MAG: sodium-dependent bicarbonate transport family permease [Alphaproteobacteria bacterium]